jgi:hypothetical protein
MFSNTRQHPTPTPHSKHLLSLRGVRVGDKLKIMPLTHPSVNFKLTTMNGLASSFLYAWTQPEHTE